MAVPVIMPRQGQSVEFCIFGGWYKNPGDKINIGDVLFSYETDKASFEEEAKESGVLLEVFCEEGDEVPVLANVAVIGQPGESVDSFRPERTSETCAAPLEDKKGSPNKEPVVTSSKIEISEDLPATTDENNIYVSPRARKLADKLGVSSNVLKGTGPGGRIIERDVEAAVISGKQSTPLALEMAAKEKMYAGSTATGLSGRARGSDLSANPSSGPCDFVIKKLPNIRKIIAKAMHTSLQESAQLTHHLGADARRILTLRKQFKSKLANSEIEENITINDMVCGAVIAALKKFPQVNSHFLGDRVKYFSRVHLGLAVDTDRGLMVPVVRDADSLSLKDLSRQMKDLAEQCRTGSIDPELLSPEMASFTVSNLGNYGVEIFTPVINLPQSAILGVNTILPRPADLGDGVYGFVPTIGLSLTYDHRSLDGGEASRFLFEIKKEIENFNT